MAASPTTLDPSLLEYALDFVRRGGFVSPCLPKTKIAQATPQGFVNRTRDPAQVHRFWTRNPNFNIAANAGVLFDVDSLKSLEAVLAFAKGIGLPETLTVHSGRRDGYYGAQLHFTGQAEHNGPYDRDGVKGEVRNLARNLYGLWAGSIHPTSGERYEIVIDRPIAPWPAGVTLAKSRPKFRASAPGADEETTAYRAVETFKRLLREARSAKEGSRNATAHALTWFAARAFLAEVFEIGFDEDHPPLSKNDIAEIIGAAVRPHYKGERDVTKMLNDSFKYGLRAGRLKLDVYWSDLDKLLAIENSERMHRLLDGNASDFPSAVEAREHLVALLDKAGFDAESRKRVLRYSQLDERVAGQILANLKIARILAEGKDDV